MQFTSEMIKMEGFNKSDDIQVPLRRDRLTKQFLPILNFLWFFGRCPLLIREEESEGISEKNNYSGIEQNFILRKVVYSFKICRHPRFVCSVISTVVLWITLILGLLQLGGLHYQIFPPGKFFPELKSLWNFGGCEGIGKLPPIIVETFEVVSTIQVIIVYFLVWPNFPSLAEWLNEWNRLEDSIDKLLIGRRSSSSNLDIRGFVWKFQLFYIWMPTIIFGALVIWPDFYYDYPLHCFLDVVNCYAINFCNQGEEARSFVMIRALEMSFKQIREIIESRTHEKIGQHSEISVVEDLFQNEADTPTSKEIREWRRILVDIRHQAWLCGRLIAPQQLMSILMTVYFGAATLFVTTTFLSTDECKESAMTVTITSTFLFVTVFGAYSKIYMASRVTSEERKITHLMKQLELTESRKDCCKEIKAIHSMLSNDPTEISLNDFLKLNNSLFLSIVGQICTLFIVLMQFQNTK